MNTILHFSIPGLILILMFNFNTNYLVFGHTFSGDENASFLTIVEMIKLESQLAEKELPSNVTISKEHAEHTAEHLSANDTKEISEKNSRLATELNRTLTDFINAFKSQSPSESEIKDKVSNIGDVLSEVVSARIDKEQLNNVTVKALVVNDLVGETLEHYGSAFGINEYSHDENNIGASNATKNGNNATAKLVDDADYQSARAAISRAIEIYNEIKPNQDKNSTQLGDSLNSLKVTIDSKAPFDEIDKIVDEKITPLLSDIFKLNLTEEDHGDHSDKEEQGQEDNGEGETHASSENDTH